MAKAPSASLPRSMLDPHPAAIALRIALLEVQRQTVLLEREVNKSAKAGVIELARSFVVVHRLKDHFDETEKVFQAFFDKTKRETVPQAFDKAGVPHVPLSEGFRVGTSSILYASIRPGMKEKAYKWLEANKLGDLIVGTVNASTLSSTARHLMEEENKELPSELFNVAPVPNTSVTATGKK